METVLRENARLQRDNERLPQQKKKEVHMGPGEDGHTVGLGVGARPYRTGDRGWVSMPTT